MAKINRYKYEIAKNCGSSVQKSIYSFYVNDIHTSKNKTFQNRFQFIKFPILLTSNGQLVNYTINYSTHYSAQCTCR